MKILAFTDIHGSLIALKRLENKIKLQKPDILLCAGDISIFEYGLVGILRKLNRLGIKIIIVHGNHEDEQNFRKYSKFFRNIVYIHNSSIIIENFLFLGYGGDGFSVIDRKFEKISKVFRKIINNNYDKKIILLTHAPAYHTKLDKLVERHCGNKSIRNFIEKNKVNLMVCGHLHENFGKEDRINRTKIINPGPFGAIIII